MILKIKDTISLTINIALAALLLDFVCLMAWAMSGQHPADSMYIGAVSKNILSAIIF